MGQQAKDVISWFSEIAQKKPKDRIVLRDVPGYPKEMVINH